MRRMSSSPWLRTGLWVMAALGAILGQIPLAEAAELTIRVLDPKGKPVPDVVVVATAQGPKQGPKNAGAKSQPPKPAVMDQIDRQFVPHLLVVETGTPVTFPNSDSVSHQVYSFSTTKRFQLALYRGHAYPPLVFDQPGIVVLGCNIHDDMIGYIYVAASPYFGKTDAQGRMLLKELPAQNYEVTLWSPRLKQPQALI